MSWFTDRLPATRGDLRILWDYVLSQTEHITRIGEGMAKNDDALAELDAQLDELEAYVLSDDETDAAEVQSRTERLRNLLSQVKQAPAEEPVNPGVPGGPEGGTTVTNPTPGAQDNPNT